LASKKEALLKKKEEEEKKPEDKKPEEPPKPSLSSNLPTLLLDSEGREIDSEGNLVGNTMERISSVKANQKFITSTKFTDLLKEEISASRGPTVNADNQKDSTKKTANFFDANLKTEKADRQTRGIKFIEPGSIVKKQEKIRNQNQNQSKFSKKEPKLLSEVVPKEEIDDVLFSVLGKKREDPPEVEWWDKFLLNSVIIGGKDEDNPEKKRNHIKNQCQKVRKKTKKNILIRNQFLQVEKNCNWRKFHILLNIQFQCFHLEKI